MRSSFKRGILAELIPAIFILLFVYTGISKLQEHSQFRSVLRKSPLIGFAAGWLSWFLPLVELVVAGFLFFPSFRRLGLLCSFILMFGFTGYIAYMILFTPDLPCSCGGVFRKMSWNQHLVFNIVLTGLAALGLYIKNTDNSLLQ